MNRKDCLKFLSTTLPLPLLDLWSDPLISDGVKAQTSPLRTLFVYSPNGVFMNDWFPKSFTKLKKEDHFVRELELSKSLQPLSELKNEFSMLTGLTLHTARANGDGGGDHARSSAAFLTGKQAKKTAGSGIRAGLSADQLIVNKSILETRWASLELGLDKGSLSGSCDSGYSCAYSNNLAWKSKNQPLPKEHRPALIFEKLFGAKGQARQRASLETMWREQKSILDLSQQQFKNMANYIGSNDQHILNEYRESIRTVEKRIAYDLKTPPNQFKTDLIIPSKTPKDIRKHAELVSELVALAFQSRSTHVITYMLGQEGSYRKYPHLGIKDGHHVISHHGHQLVNTKKIQKIDHFYSQVFAQLLSKLKSKKEGNRDLLYHSQIVYGSGMSDGHKHDHAYLPILLAGHAGGKLKPKQWIHHPKETPLCNLYLQLFKNLDLSVNQFGDSKGFLKGLG